MSKSEKQFFENLHEEILEDIKETSDNIDYRKKAIIKQKTYIRDSDGDMDDEEFLQNMQNVNTDVLFVDHAQKKLDKLKKQADSPYFGKLSFVYEDKEELPVYVGTTGYWSDVKDDQVVFDWRSPVASMYYDFEKGKAFYEAPDGQFNGEIIEKKQFDIKKGRFKSAVDTNERINDEVLVNALSSNSGTHMQNVVATIQKEQNIIIRNKTAKNLIVDGRAGSGKTVIAMHRLAWLMFNHRNTIKADNVMILSPNAIFADYISEVLPQIGEDSVPGKEFDALMEEILFIDQEYESKLEQSDTIIALSGQEYSEDKEAVKRLSNIKYKSSIEFFKGLNQYAEKYIKSIGFKDFHFQKVVFEKEKLEKMFFERFARYPVYERFSKIAFFITDRLEEDSPKEFSSEKKHKLESQIQHEMIYQYAERNLVSLYKGYLEELKNNVSGISEFTNEYGKICYEDILPIFYLQLFFYGCNSYKNIKHLVIDEMQDYNIFQFAAIQKIFDCPKTILGDKYQVLFYDPEETVVDVLKEVFSKDSFEIKELSTSYRSTKEITQFCNKILQEENAKQLAEIFSRHGKEPQELQINKLSDICQFISEKLSYGDMDEYDNIAVLLDDERDAFDLFTELSKSEEVTFVTRDSVIYSGGVVVLPKFLAKGMEFDAVFVINNEKEMKNKAQINAYYISCTRALHELYVINRN